MSKARQWASRRTVLQQPVAMHWLPREVPNLLPSVFRGLNASVVRARGVFEAGHRSKDPVDSRFGDFVGVLAHVEEGAAGGALVVWRIGCWGARGKGQLVCNLACSFVSCGTAYRPEVGKF